MEWNIVLSVIFGAAAVVGGIETTYQLYKLTVMEATIEMRRRALDLPEDSLDKS